jgi:antitoxin (DNA-binding transcriptional repressor) of toxin-antitoxin stability system
MAIKKATTKKAARKSGTTSPRAARKTDPLTAAGEQVAKTGRPRVLKSGGKAVAAIIPIAELRELRRLRERAEDRRDAAEADAALDDLAAGRETLVPLDEVRRELGI